MIIYLDNKRFRVYTQYNAINPISRLRIKENLKKWANGKCQLYRNDLNMI